MRAAPPRAPPLYAIKKYNGNTTNFNRCPAPKSSALVMPIQDGVAPVTTMFTTHPVRMIRPM